MGFKGLNRDLPERLRQIITRERKRALRPSELAQLMVNLTRRYPDYHDQNTFCGGGNQACLVGWGTSLMAGRTPSSLARMTDSGVVKLLTGRRVESDESPDVVVPVAKRLGVSAQKLREKVFYVSDADEAIANFCALTGAKDPGARAGKVAA